MIVESVLLQYRFNPFSTLLLTFCFTFIVWYIQYVWTRRKIYKVALKRPGPLALPLIGNNLSFIGSNCDNLYKVENLVSSYDNPVRVWLGPDLFFLTEDLKDAEKIFTSPFAWSRGDFFKFLKRTAGYGLFTAPHEKWKRNRKVITPTFNMKILDGFVPIFSEKCSVLIETLEIFAGKGMFDVQDSLSRCILDIFCETAIGVKMNLQVDRHDFVDWVHKTMEIAMVRAFSIWYQFDCVFNLTPLGKEFDYAATKVCGFVEDVIRDKRAEYRRKVEYNKKHPEAAISEETKRNSFLEQLVELSETGANFTDVELREEVCTVMGAGTDTSTMFNSFALVMLGMYPEIQEQLYTELMNVVGSDRPIEAEDLSKLHLLDRVVKETLRLFPVAPYIIRKAYGDIQLDKMLVPAGCTVVVAAFNIHRNPKNYPDPYKFDPNRFLPEEVAKRSPYTWMPFGMGLRNCIGMRYAQQVSKVILAVILRKYKIRSKFERVDEMKLQMDITLKKIDGFNIAIELRE